MNRFFLLALALCALLLGFHGGECAFAKDGVKKKSPPAAKQAEKAEAAPLPAPVVMSEEEKAAPPKPKLDQRAWLGQTRAISSAAVKDVVAEWNTWVDACTTYWHNLPSHKKEADRLEAVYLHCPLNKDREWTVMFDSQIDCARLQKGCEDGQSPKQYTKRNAGSLENTYILLSDAVLAQIWKDRVQIVQRGIADGFSPIAIEGIVYEAYIRTAETFYTASLSRVSRKR